MSYIFLFQVQLEHGGGNKEAGPWEVNIDHAITKCEETEAVLIVATVTGERSRIQTFPFHVSLQTNKRRQFSATMLPS
jgi:hypothetical protein